MLKKRFVLEIAGLAVLIILTVAVTLTILNARNTYKDDNMLNSKKSAESRDDTATDRIDISEFILKKSKVDFSSYGPFLLREKHTKWSLEETDKYWKDPVKLLGEILERENESKVEKLLKQ